MNNKIIKKNFFLLKKTFKDNILQLTFNNIEKNNSLSANFLQELEANINDIQNCHDTRVVIFNSSHPKIFCAGADLKERLDMSENDIRLFVSRLRNTFHLVSKIKIPTIACINGFALGGGLEFALSCDIRLATKRSTLGLTETSLAIIPGAGGTQNLSRIVGIAKAKEMIYTSMKLTGEEALRINLINHLLENEEELTLKANEISKKIILNGPISIKAAKEAIDEGYNLKKEEALRVEERCYEKVLYSKDRIEGLKSFNEKRKPEYKGH